MKRWIQVSAIVLAIVVVITIIAVYSISRRKKAAAAATNAEIQKNIDTLLPAEYVRERDSISSKNTNDTGAGQTSSPAEAAGMLDMFVPGDFQQDWGDTDTSHWTQQRDIEATTTADNEEQIHLLLRAVLTSLYSQSAGQTYDSVIGPVVDYLTPSFTEKLLENEPIFVNSVDATVESIALSRIESTHYIASVAMTLQNYRILDYNEETNVFITEQLGTQRKILNVDIVKVAKYWFVNDINEK